MNSPHHPDNSALWLPGVPVDTAKNSAPLVRGTADPTAATINGVSCFSVQPASNGPVIVAIHHSRSTVNAAEIRYDIWARQDDAAIAAVVEYMPVLLGVDEPSLAAWAAFDELLDQTAHLLPTAVLEARRQNPGMRLMATG